MFVLRLEHNAEINYLKCDQYGTFESMRLVRFPWDATVIEMRSTAYEFKERAEGFFRMKGKVMSLQELAMSPTTVKASA